MKVDNLSANTEPIKTDEINKKTKENKEEKVTKTNTRKKTNAKVKKSFPKDMTIKIISNSDGVLVYSSPNGMVSFEIDEYGGYDYVELSTLLAMRNANRRFFEENWIVIGDTDEYKAEDIYDFLKISHYYNNVFTPDNIDKLFNLEPQRIEEIVSNYPISLKRTIYRIAKDKYKNNELQLIATIRAIENAVGLKFDEE